MADRRACTARKARQASPLIASSRGCEAASSAQAGSPAMPWIAIELRPPGPGLRHPPGSSPGPAALQATDTGGCAPPPSPHPPDLGWSSFKRRNDTGSLRIPSRLAHRSGPSGSPEPARLCRGCFDPPRHPPGQAAASFHPTATTGRRQGLSRPPETSAPRGATQRLDRLSRWVHDRRLCTFSALYHTRHTMSCNPGPSSIPPGQSLFPDAALDAAESVDKRGSPLSIWESPRLIGPLGLTARGREPHPASTTHSGQPHRPVGRRRTTRLP